MGEAYVGCHYGHSRSQAHQQMVVGEVGAVHSKGEHCPTY